MILLRRRVSCAAPSQPQLPRTPLPLLHSRIRHSSKGSITISTGEEFSMSTKEVEAPPPPKLVVLNRAFKLAEQWVNNMSGAIEDELREVELESRPYRLGIGATAPRESMYETSNNSVERKLRAKLDPKKRKAGKEAEESNPGDGDDDYDSDEDFVSKAVMFTKRKLAPQAAFAQQPKKKMK